MQTKEILQKIFGVLSSLYLLYGAVLCGFVIVTNGIIFKGLFESIDASLSLIFVLVAFITAIVLFIKHIFNPQKLDNNLVSLLLLVSGFTACFAFSFELKNIAHYIYSPLLLAVMLLANIFILKQPKNSKGVMLIGGSVAYLIVAIITAAPYISTAIYALNPLIGDSLLKFDYSYIIIIVICILAAFSFLGEGVYILINAISKRFNKNTYIIMFVWAALNVALKIIIPPQLTSTSLYLFYSFFGVIDTWLVYVNWNLLRYFIYMLFVYHSLNFYKKEKTEEIQQLS